MANYWRSAHETVGVSCWTYIDIICVPIILEAIAYRTGKHDKHDIVSIFVCRSVGGRTVADFRKVRPLTLGRFVGLHAFVSNILSAATTAGTVGQALCFTTKFCYGLPQTTILLNGTVSIAPRDDPGDD